MKTNLPPEPDDQDQDQDPDDQHYTPDEIREMIIQDH
jgi:hypothetical protein